MEEPQRGPCHPQIIHLHLHLPEEIIIEILVQMPIKSLVRFRCVCKRWRSLLSDDRDFSTRYLCRKPPCHDYLLTSRILLFRERCLLLSLIQYQLPDRTVQIQPPLLENPRLLCLDVIGCIDGVFCLYYQVELHGGMDIAMSIVLWNPTTREFHRTPHPETFVSKIWSLNWSFGFARGADETSFKVVMITCKSHCPTSLGFPVESPIVKGVEVYDSRSDAWTKMDNPPNTFHSSHRVPCAVVNGVPYWRATDWSGSIISFDPVANQFRQFKGPEFGVEVVNDQSWSVGEFEESLVAIAPGQDKGVNVWKLVDGKSDHGEVIWIKQFSFGPADGVEQWVKCWKNGEFLVRTKLGYCLWDGWSNQIRVFPDLPSPDWRMVSVFLFTESLVPPRHHVLPHLNPANPGEDEVW